MLGYDEYYNSVIHGLIQMLEIVYRVATKSVPVLPASQAAEGYNGFFNNI